MVSKCQAVFNGHDELMSKIAENMLNKLESYASVSKSHIADVARALDPQSRTDIIPDNSILRSYILLLSPTPRTDVFSSTSSSSQQRSILDEAVEDESRKWSVTIPYCWWNLQVREINKQSYSLNQHFEMVEISGINFPTITKVAKDLLPIHCSSVASESRLSVAGDLIDDKRTRLADDSIRFCMLLRSWQKIAQRPIYLPMFWVYHKVAYRFKRVLTCSVRFPLLSKAIWFYKISSGLVWFRERNCLSDRFEIFVPLITVQLKFYLFIAGQARDIIRRLLASRYLSVNITNRSATKIVIKNPKYINTVDLQSSYDHLAHLQYNHVDLIVTLLSLYQITASEKTNSK